MQVNILRPEVRVKSRASESLTISARVTNIGDLALAGLTLNEINEGRRIVLSHLYALDVPEFFFVNG